MSKSSSAKYLAGVQNTVRVERSLDAPHHLELRRAAGAVEKVAFQDADAVFRRDRAVVAANKGVDDPVDLVQRLGVRVRLREGDVQVPASTVIVAAALSISSMPLIRSSEMTISSASGLAPPARPVMPPCGTTLWRCSLQMLRAVATSATLAGRMMAFGRLRPLRLASLR
ncbi:hypothetical protein ABIE78_002408 [Sinorhizobium fredii]